MASSIGPKRVALAALIFSSLSGCATLSSLWPFGSSDAKEDETKVTEAVVPKKEDLKEELDASKKQIAELKMELRSLKESLMTVRRNVQVLSRGARSGVYYEDPNFDGESHPLGFEEGQKVLKSEGDKVETAKPTESKEGNTPLDDKGNKKLEASTPDLRSQVGRTGVDEAVADPGDDGISEPAKLVAEAELKMQRGQYGEVVVTLKALQHDFPDFQDEGQSSLLLAEAWLKLKSYENIFPLLRSFYLKYPHSHDMLRAKLVEAQTFEGMGSPERAANLYREVVAQGPQTSFAKDARASLQRMRDSR